MSEGRWRMTDSLWGIAFRPDIAFMPDGSIVVGRQWKERPDEHMARFRVERKEEGGNDEQIR